MEKVTLEVGSSPKIRILNVGGDLRLSGREGSNFEAQAPGSGKLEVEEKEDWVEVGCRSGCLIFLPTEAQVEGGDVGGDMRATGLDQEVMIQTIGGDLSLRRIGRATFEIIGGDMRARKLSGDLSIDRIGGDAVIERVEGNVTIRSIGGDAIANGVEGDADISVGGDLVINKFEGTLKAQAGGDARISFSTAPQPGSKIGVGGDLFCRLPEDASLVVRVSAGGDLHMPSAASMESGEEDSLLVKLGEAEGEEPPLELSSGGDLWLQVGSSGEGVFVNTMMGDVLGELDAEMADMEARFNAYGAGFSGFDAERIGERVRKAVAKAQRNAERASRHLERLGVPPIPPISPMSSAGASQVSEEERLKILKMVEAGTISVEEAETLLQALEGES
ncbi:MAG: hypothetical protein PVG63_04460 [Anaerolineales bacterium]